MCTITNRQPWQIKETMLLDQHVDYQKLFIRFYTKQTTNKPSKSSVNEKKKKIGWGWTFLPTWNDGSPLIFLHPCKYKINFLIFPTPKRFIKLLSNPWNATDKLVPVGSIGKRPMYLSVKFFKRGKKLNSKPFLGPLLSNTPPSFSLSPLNFYWYIKR